MDKQDLKLEEIMGTEKSFLKKRSNGLMLSDEDIEILSMYDIDYLKYKTLEELIFAISQVLDETSADIIPLEELSVKLGEYNYYNYTNK